MNTINNYVETIFMNLPDTQELAELKQDILVNMEEKYQELLSDGLSDNEAIGLVISEFGNIDELLNELEIKKQETNKEFKTSLYSQLSFEEIDEFIAMRKSLGTGVGFGVILCGIAASMIIFAVHLEAVITGVILSMFVIAVAVALFITSGLKASRFNYLEKGFLAEPQNLNYIKNENKAYEKSFVFSLIIGITLVILSSIPVLIGSQHTENILLYACGTIVIATVGCFFLIYGGTVKGGFTFLLENGIDSSISEADIKNKLYWKRFNENFWLVIAAVYLLVSFVFGIWSISWIIFPVAGVLSGIWMNGKE